VTNSVGTVGTAGAQDNPFGKINLNLPSGAKAPAKFSITLIDAIF
jgi:hypothetical protein